MSLEERIAHLEALLANVMIQPNTMLGFDTIYPWNTRISVGTNLPMQIRGECDSGAASAEAQHAIVGVSATCPDSPMNAGLVGVGTKNTTGVRAGAYLLASKKPGQKVAHCLYGQDTDDGASANYGQFGMGPQGITIIPGNGPLPTWIVDLYGWKFVIEPPQLWFERPDGSRVLVAQ